MAAVVACFERYHALLTPCRFAKNPSVSDVLCDDQTRVPDSTLLKGLYHWRLRSVHPSSVPTLNVKSETFHFFFSDAAPGDGILRPIGQGMVVLHDDFHDAALGLLQDFSQPFADRLLVQFGTAKAAGLGFSEKMYLSPRASAIFSTFTQAEHDTRRRL